MNRAASARAIGRGIRPLWATTILYVYSASLEDLYFQLFADVLEPSAKVFDDLVFKSKVGGKPGTLMGRIYSPSESQ